METYFDATIQSLKCNDYNNITLVIGNESCDLDSAVSALCYATFLYWQHNQIQCKICTRKYRSECPKDDLFVPILNIDREDYSLKTEVKFSFNEFRIDDSKLVFRDDIDLDAILKEHKVSVVLVDHHILTKRDECFRPYVIEIIDHRPIDHDNWNYKDDTRSTTEVVGSCCSLVTRRIEELHTLTKLRPGELPFHRVMTHCAPLLHETIILDTVNFSKEVDKATRLDEEMVIYLETLIKPESVEEYRKAKLDQLVEARKDVSSLTADQLLRKDLKVLSDVLVPSFPILVEEFFQKSNSLKAVNEALEKRGCRTALLLGMSLQSGLKRDGAVSGRNSEEILKFLQEWRKPSLQLEVTSLPALEDSNCTYFVQKYLPASRKQYIAALNEYFQAR